MGDACHPGTAAGVVCVRGEVGCPVDHPISGTDRVPVDPDVLGMLLAASVRYALGRRSHLVAEVIDAVHAHLDAVPWRWRQTILRDVALELRAARAGGDTVGDEADDAAWTALAGWPSGRGPG